MSKEDMELYEQLVERGVATSREINLVKSVASGSWNEILHAILFVRTNCKTIIQLIEEVGE